MTAYRSDLAYIHDVGHGDFARQAAPGLLALLQSRGITTGLVIDLGCGSGIWAQELVQAGYQVLGVDISPDMIGIARKRAPGAEFRCGSFLKMQLPGCGAVTSIGECFNYLFDRKNSLPALARLFRRIHRALEPGGVLVFDVLQPGHLGENRLQRRFREGPDWAVLVELEENAEEERLTRRITSFRKVGRLYRRDSETHTVQLFHGNDVASQLRRAGFRVTRLRGYGEQKFSGSQIAFLARKATR